ncbi:hypothetical protein [Brucella pseudogrignonensis]|uniref:hypothetical protein n=1 Tax=Brucella pseudogrignonensis TaxID=419475 RepID=UPI0038CF9034
MVKILAIRQKVALPAILHAADASNRGFDACSAKWQMDNYRGPWSLHGSDHVTTIDMSKCFLIPRAAWQNRICKVSLFDPRKWPTDKPTGFIEDHKQGQVAQAVQ